MQQAGTAHFLAIPSPSFVSSEASVVGELDHVAITRLGQILVLAFLDGLQLLLDELAATLGDGFDTRALVGVALRRLGSRHSDGERQHGY